MTISLTSATVPVKLPQARQVIQHVVGQPTPSLTQQSLLLLLTAQTRIRTTVMPNPPTYLHVKKCAPSTLLSLKMRLMIALSPSLMFCVAALLLKLQRHHLTRFRK